MITNPNSRNRPKPPGIKSFLDYFMALVWIFFGFLILFPEQIAGVDLFKNKPILQGGMKWVIGSLFLLYGVFRGYRGYIASKKSSQDDE
jgi:threonine/homoserine/homoserine lactone efflux protein